MSRPAQLFFVEPKHFLSCSFYTGYTVYGTMEHTKAHVELIRPHDLFQLGLDVFRKEPVLSGAIVDGSILDVTMLL